MSLSSASRSRVVIAYPELSDDADPSTLAVLEQVALVEEGLEALGESYTRAAVAGGRAWELKEWLGAHSVVFNLLEAPPGLPQHHAAATAVLELLQVPFTGCGATALWLTTDKVATRAALAAAGLPVAAGGGVDPQAPKLPAGVAFPVIVKPAWEDASVGLDGNPICRNQEELTARVQSLASRFVGQPILVEEFLPGREFNISLLEGGDGLMVLPVAEIVFRHLPPDVPPIVGYEAKWHPGSPADVGTVRTFPPENEEGGLLFRLRELATAAWQTCGVSGYARVDLRLRSRGEPRILEVNANPCLSFDAGFMAAARQAGLNVAEVVGTLLEGARRRFRQGAG